MARERKRTRQRRPRPIREGARANATGAPADRMPPGADLPGALAHTGDVDEFDAALVRGAGGVPVEEQQQSEPGAPAGADGDGALEAEPVELVSAAGGRGGRRGGGRQTAEDAFGDGAAPELAPEAAPAAKRPSQPIWVRAVAFLRASWAELQRVQWPDRRQVTQATAVVLGFVAIMGAYLGIADWAAQKIVNFIL